MNTEYDWGMLADMLDAEHDAEHDAGGHKPGKYPVRGCKQCQEFGYYPMDEED